MAEAGDSKVLIHTGPDKDVEYPISVPYCKVCDNWPVEYIEWHPKREAGEKWVMDNMSADVANLLTIDQDGGDDPEQKKRQKRGGKGVVKTKNKDIANEKPAIKLYKQSRGKKKCSTIIIGLKTCGIKLDQAKKDLSTKYAASASITDRENDEISILGEHTDDLFDFLPSKYGIDEDVIEDCGDYKKRTV